MSRIYLDYNAGAPLKPCAYEKMLEVLRLWGNASSVHTDGRHLFNIVENARHQVADALETDIRDVIFTSCGSEANNLVIRGFEEQGFRILVCATDHVSTLYASDKAIQLPVSVDGILNLERLEELLQERMPTLVSVHMANNETGVIQPLSDIMRLVKSYGAFIHTDAVQAVGRIPVSFRTLGVDALTVASSKIGGPAGAGALILKETIVLPSLIRGGAQEKNRRAGTHNVAAIAGFGIALQEAVRDDWYRVEKLRDSFEGKIQKKVQGIEIYGALSPRLPNTSLVRLPKISNELQLMNLDLAGYALSAGAACSSGKIGVSHVLLAMGIPENHAREAVRVSLCPDITGEEIDSFITAWLKAYEHHQAIAA